MTEDQEKQVISELVDLAQTRLQTEWLALQAQSIGYKKKMESLTELIKLAEQSELDAKRSLQRYKDEHENMYSPKQLQHILGVIISNLNKNEYY
jgi:hypothetical protein